MSVDIGGIPFDPRRLAGGNPPPGGSVDIAGIPFNASTLAAGAPTPAQSAQQGLTLQDFGASNDSLLRNFYNTQHGQNDLAQALIAQQNGQGPNPAQSMLTAAQGQNAAQAAGVYANNRAINPALAARQAATMQAQTNQTAGNQAATLRAQQQLAAQGQLGGLYGQMAGQNANLYGVNQQATAARNQAVNQQYATQVQQQLGQQQNKNNVIGSILGGIGTLGAAAIGAAHGGEIPQSFASFLQGGHVPGKALVSGDNKKNDTVPAMLSPGEVVIPRSASSDPEKAKEFIDHIMKNKEKGGGYGQMMVKHRELSNRISEIEKRLGKKAS